jgi:hypothetical protein
LLAGLAATLAMVVFAPTVRSHHSSAHPNGRFIASDVGPCSAIDVVTG